MYFFFTINDFEKDGGGTIRMLGILNSLAENGEGVTLISNAKSLKCFHPSIKHIFLGISFLKKKKRIFQFMLALFPNFINKFIFKDSLSVIRLIIDNNVKCNTPIIFFEYLDTSIALFLKKQKIIEKYIFDVHGSARLEFLNKNPDSILLKSLFFCKYLVASILDKKIYMNATSIIFLSESMKTYFEEYYNFITSYNNIVIRDAVSKNFGQNLINHEIVNKYRKALKIFPNDNVILFAGSFKSSGGVIDLVKSFHLLKCRNKIFNLKLLLLGDGECYDKVLKFIKMNSLESAVTLVGRFSFNELWNYQELADVIVCPDKQSYLSELVPHIKYFNALVSSKVVINGSFASIKDINKDERLSVNFIPSDIDDLSNKIQMVLMDLDFYKLKYQHNKEKVFNEFSYSKSIEALIRG